ARTRPLSGCPPSITNDSATGLASVVDKARTMLEACGEDTVGCLGNADALYEERGASAACARGRGLDGVVRPRRRRGRGALAGGCAPARLRLRDAPDARQASAGRGAPAARGGVLGRGRRDGPVTRKPSRAAARHAAQADAVRVRRTVGLHPRLRARPAYRSRRARAEVGAQEAEAAVVRVGRLP